MPGDYKVEWNGTGSNVTVNFVKDRKTVATAPGEIVRLDKPATGNEIVMKPVNNRRAKTIEEIDFANRTEAVKIEPPMSANPGSTQER